VPDGTTVPAVSLVGGAGHPALLGEHPVDVHFVHAGSF